MSAVDPARGNPVPGNPVTADPVTADPVTADLLDLLDYAMRRLAGRLAGLDDAEWAWTPTGDDRIGIRWRLQHIADLLSMERNWTWLGLPAPQEPMPATPTIGRGPGGGGPSLSAAGDAAAGGAADAIAAVDAAYRHWRDALGPCSDEQLAAPIGPLAAPYYAEASRPSFVLHIADELIHHGAETALLRDLYRERS